MPVLSKTEFTSQLNYNKVFFVAITITVGKNTKFTSVKQKNEVRNDVEVFDMPKEDKNITMNDRYIDILKCV